MTLFKLLLSVHIVSGSLSLLIGLYLMVAKKGTRLHKSVGRVYYFAMLVSAIVAIPMCYLHTNYFLFLISIFTIYMLLTGVRYLRKKKLGDVKPLDWVITTVMLLFALTFIGFGCYHLYLSNSFGIVFLAFGSIGLFFSYLDWKNFTGKSKVKNVFLTAHLQRMVGSYIASVTAFLVVNNTILPPVMAWLLPTLIMVPLIIRWSKKYQVAKVN